jgi:RNA polymerase sigma-70 factor, ECF subfamily
MTESPQTPAEILAHHAERLAGYLISLGATAGEAEDLVQDVAVAVTDSPATPDNPLAWLLTIARRRWIDRLRHREVHQRRELPLDALDEALSATFAEPDPDLDLSMETEAAALRICLGHLAPQARRMIDLHYWQDCDAESIAQTLSWQENAVRVALSKIRRTLAECVQRTLRRGKDSHAGT